MKRLVLAGLLVLVNVAPTRAQSFTVAPTFSFGYGITDGAHDHIRDEPTVLQRICALEPMPFVSAFNAFASEPPAACRQTKRAPFSPYGGVGIMFAGALTSRLAVASSLDITVGSTHRIGEQSRAGGVGVSSGWAEGQYPAMMYELTYRRHTRRGAPCEPRCRRRRRTTALARRARDVVPLRDRRAIAS